MRRLNPTVLAAIALGLIVLLIVAVVALRGRGANEDRLGDDTRNETAQAEGPAERCGSQRTYDAIKLELFRQAAEMRGSDQAAFDRLAPYAAVRMDRPVLRSQDEELGTIRCSGRLSLDLPPGVAVVGGRRTLGADIDYVVQPAADGSGDIVILEGADPIVIPLATLARAGSNMPPPEAPRAADPGDALGDQPPAAPEPPEAPSPTPAPEPAAPPAPPPAAQPPQPEPAPKPQVSARPSFNCRYARTRGEIAVCNDAGLAALDRQMSSQYFRAVRNADAQQREQLRRTRTSFLRYRDRCRNDACVAGAYRDRMREIADIMAGRWQQP